MARYADIDVLLEHLTASDEGNFRTAITQWLEMHQVEDVAPGVHAHWIDGDIRLLEDGFIREKVIESTCSRCKRPLFTDPRARDYCPNCNAKMDEEVE